MVKAGALTSCAFCRYPHITFTRCTAHTLDLMLEDICKLPWAKRIRDEAMAIVHFITNHHKSLALYRAQSKRHSGDLQLKKPGEHACTLQLQALQSSICSIWHADMSAIQLCFMHSSNSLSLQSVVH